MEYHAPTEEVVEQIPEKEIDVGEDSLKQLSLLINETDLCSFKSYIQNLKEGTIALDTPLILD
jgi:hypothetical protein